MPEKVSIVWDDLLDLVLDEQNPRHEATSDRAAIIRQMVEKESVLQLARDIVKVDGISPLDVFAGIRDGEQIIVLDGNRRLTALLLLHDPNLSPPNERSIFKKLAEAFKKSITIEVAVFATRTEANLWIERKHQGANNGIGMRDWDAVQKARFMGARSGNALALSLMDYALKNRLISAEQRAQRVLTTVTRYVSNHVFRVEGLGITTGRADPDFQFRGSAKSFKLRLGRFFQDLYAEQGPVTSRSNAEDREKYARTTLVPMDPTIAARPKSEAADQETPRRGQSEGKNSSDESSPDVERDNQNDDLDDSGTANSERGGNEPADGANKPKKPQPNHATRRQFLPDASRFETSKSKLQRIVHELSRTDHDHPLAAALLARVLIESIFFDYAEEIMGRTISDRDKQHVVVQDVLTHFDAANTSDGTKLSRDERSAMTMFRTMVSNRAWVFSGFYLGAVAHGQAFPDWRELTSKWDEVESIVVRVLKRLK